MEILLLSLVLGGLVVTGAVVYANIFPQLADDTAYCTSFTLPGTESDLGPAVQITSASTVGATSLTVGALNAALANGTILTFPDANSNPVQVTLTAAAVATATSLAVAAIPVALPANSYALNQGAPLILPAGVQSILALVTLVTTVATAGVTYVVLQTDLGDGTWVDVAWVKVAAPIVGTATYQLSTALGASEPAVQRANGTAPGNSGANATPLGARIRFTGQSTASGGSVVKATVKFKYQGLR